MLYVQTEDAISRVKNGPLSLKESAYIFKRALTDKSYAGRVYEAIGTESFDNFLQGSIDARVKMKVMEEKKLSDILSFTERGSSREESILNMKGLTGVFDEVEEGKNYPVTEFKSEEEFVKTAKYGEIIEVTEEMIYFDKTGELNRMVDKLAKKAVRTKDDLILEALVDGANIGNKSEGVYTTERENLGEAALSEKSLYERIKSFRSRKDNSGNAVDVAPNVLLVTPELEVTARKLLKETGYTNTENANVVPDMINGTKLIVSARLSEIISIYDTSLSKNSWFMLREREGIIYYEVWPLEVFSEQEGEGGFMKDSFRYKLRFFGGAGVYAKELLDANFVTD